MNTLEDSEFLTLEFNIDECAMLVNALRVKFASKPKERVWIINHPLYDIFKGLFPLTNIYLARENNETIL